MPHNTVNVAEGKAVLLEIDWTDFTGNPEAPQAVKYQVFDQRTGVAVSPVMNVQGVSASMSFIIPAIHLPIGNARDRRYLVVQIGGSFNTDYDPEQVVIAVEKQYATLAA